jgi:2-polyprenyl-6-methoxyphenol hydroxylase-like FAD-dependent oxidoreductase
MHSSPPTYAQGAALALEDAAALSEPHVARPAVDDHRWTAFTARRYERVRQVVASSSQLCQWLLDGVRGDVPGLIQSRATLVSEPA